MEILKPLSPEWFKEKAKEDRYKNIDAETNKIYKEFQNEYSIEKIKSLSGEDILNKFCLGKTESNLCYKLEFMPILRGFGDIRGGSSAKYEIYFNKDNNWYFKTNLISEQDAIKFSMELRDKIILGAEIIKKHGEIKDYTDYVNVFRDLNKLKDIDKLWILKYYHMLFPNIFPPFYSDTWHMHILFNLGLKIEPEERFLRMGRIACFVKECNISNITFAKIIGDYIGEPKKFFRIGTGDNNFDSWKANNYVAIGWNELGNLSAFFVGNKEKLIKQKIHLNLEKVYKKDKATITKKTNEIYNFYGTKKEYSYIVAMKGKEVLGLGLLKGDYFFDDKNKNINKYAHCRNVEWLAFPNKIQIGEGKLTTFCELGNTDNICRLYNLMNSNNITWSEKMNKNNNQPLNQILYGPPGTGKTYNTIIKSMEIINPAEYKNKKIDDNKYKEAKEEFDKLKQSGQIEFITFHQSYSYEEFIEGIKPDLKNEHIKYKIEDGILKKIVTKAIKFEHIFNIFKEEHPDWTELRTNYDNSSFYIKYNNKSIEIYKSKENLELKPITTIPYENLEKQFDLDFKYNFKTQTDLQNKLNTNSSLSYHFAILLELRKYIKPHILIIDEINRGNISKIFGEMITLIEEDKRIGNEHELKLTLPYSKEEQFGIPNNLYIIGTMNTSDRSIASVDIALRRRFKFIEMMPKEGLVSDILIGNGKTFRDIFKALNEKITILLDRDHQIGHSYFIKDKFKSSNGEELNNENKIELLKNVWFDEILPLLNEYFYNDWEKLQALLGAASKNNDSFIVVKETKLPFYQYDIEDKVYDFIDKKNLNNENFEKALLKIIEEPKLKQKETDEQ